MDNKIIDKILEDIYLIDNDLRKNEKQLLKIINELIISKPDTKFDDNFAVSLRKEVLQKVEEMENVSKLKKEKLINIFNFNFMKKTYLIGGGLVICLLIIVFGLNFLPKSKTQTSILSQASKTETLDLKTKIARVDSNAFGNFSTPANGASQAMNSASYANDQMVKSAPVAVGGGGANSLMANSRSIASGIATSKPLGLETAPTADAKMIAGFAPQFITYNYDYKGEDFTIPAQGDVYKKIIKEGAGKVLAQKLNGDLGMIDLNKFQNTSMQNFSISEDREFGYILNFDLQNNNVSIYQNWSKWPQPDKGCVDEACFAKSRMKIEDIPADTDVVAIANQAIADYGIDISGYGEGKVNNSWRQSYDAATDKTNVWIPDTISVVYPLKIEGKEVSDDYGNLTGISVDVNVRYKKMSGIQGVGLSDYQASSYNLETDKERILKFAKQGGLWSGYMTYGVKKEVNIELGTPTLGLIANWKYNNDNGQGENYYIPAMIFPITSKSDDAFYSRKSVSVPLLKELLDQADAGNTGGNPIPEPMMRAVETGAGVSGSGGSIAPAPAPMVK